MSYKPLTKQQAENMARPPLIEDGTYQFEVMELHNVDKHNNPLIDKNREPMTKAVLKIWDMMGRERLVFTNIFWGEQNKMSYRTRLFAESIGAIDLYESGKMLENLKECLSKSGYCEVYTQKSRLKDDGSGESWPAKNEVGNFVAKPIARPQEKDDEAPFFDDNVPF